MKRMPELDVDCNELYRSLYAPVRSKLLLAAIELKIFDGLSRHSSAEAVARAIGAHLRNTEIFLDGLVACDFLEKRNSLYRNTSASQAFLVEGGPTYLGTVLTDSSKMLLAGLDDLPGLIREGPPTPSKDADISSEDVWVHFAKSMANYERVAAQQVVKVISGLQEFPSLGRMLDLGGGPGIYGIAIVSGHPNMKGVIFDRPAVVKVAESFIKEYELEDRMDVMGGDYFHDSIGGGYDLIWACATLNFYKDDLDSLMQKIHSALNPGGVFVSFQDGLTRERTKPSEMVLGMLSSALIGQDLGFDQGFIADSMLRVGFKSVCSRTLNTPGGPMDLDIGRKAK